MSNKNKRTAKEIATATATTTSNVESNDLGLNLEALGTNEADEAVAPEVPQVKLGRNSKAAAEAVANAVEHTIEWLTVNDPTTCFIAGETSSKYDAEREPKVQNGLKAIASLSGDFQINPLLILLAKWWEVKSIRSEIKKLIDAEALAKGIAPDVYLQVELNKQVEGLSNFQSAIDRVRYAKTYYKPRAGLSTKVPSKKLQIDGTIYIVPIAEYESAKIEFAGDREAMKAYIKSVSQIEVIDSIETI